MPVRVRRVCLALALVGIACLVVAFLERHVTAANTSGIGIVGAYFNRSVGTSNATFSVYGNWFRPVELLNPYLWAGAGIAFLAAAATCAAVFRRYEPSDTSA
jgi:hypothetical protein